MAIPLDQGLRILDAVRSGHMSRDEALTALTVIDDGRRSAVTEAQQADQEAMIRCYLDNGLLPAGYRRGPGAIVQPTPECLAERRPYVTRLTPADLDRGET